MNTFVFFNLVPVFSSIDIYIIDVNFMMVTLPA